MKNNAITYLARNVREVRRREKLSQRELARRMNVSACYIGYIESGKRFPSSEKLSALAETLGVSLSSLFRSGEEPFPSVSGQGWYELQGLVEEISVRTEEIHELLEKFQKTKE
ncbi:MAG: helix-turn-helix transcriptional regulator [Spirochaetaceae bacterium]|nr:helix-turn-helix transcriptional regulator [Spirochaetaceae bacterium]